jgi:hypothetical protein
MAVPRLNGEIFLHRVEKSSRRRRLRAAAAAVGFEAEEPRRARWGCGRSDAMTGFLCTKADQFF